MPKPPSSQLRELIPNFWQPLLYKEPCNAKVPKPLPGRWSAWLLPLAPAVGGPSPAPSPSLSSSPAAPPGVGLPPPVPAPNRAQQQINLQLGARDCCCDGYYAVSCPALMINNPGSMSAPACCLSNSPSIASSDIPTNNWGTELPRKHPWGWVGIQDGFSLGQGGGGREGEPGRKAVPGKGCIASFLHPGQPVPFEDVLSSQIRNVLARLLQRAGEIPRSGHSLGT